jgi:uncharacterized protein YoaH (UPF0181 family)
MANEKDVKIGIQTTADTSGADKAVDAIDEVVDKADEVVEKLKPTSAPNVIEEIPGNVKPAVRSVDELTTEVGRLDREMSATETQTRKFGTELAKTGNTSEGVASKLGGRLKGSIQQAGFQIQDFAVQVGGGTSAMTAFGQQAPQFLGAFGPAGSIAGAIIAIGAVAYNVFTKMGDDALSASEKLEFMNEVIDQIAKNKTDELNQEFADTAEAFDLAQRKAAALKTGVEEVVKSERRLALAQLDRRALERESATAEANRIAADEGKPIDTERIASDAALRIQERAQELARQGVATEETRVSQATEAARLKTEELEAAEKARFKAIAQLAAERDRLDVMRAQNEELKKQAQARSTDDPGLQIIGSVFPKLIPRTPAAKEAQKKLDDPAARSEKEVLEKRIEVLEKLVTGPDAELNRNVADLSVEVLAARTNVSNIVKAANNNAAAINLDLGTAQKKQDTRARDASDQSLANVGDATSDAVAEALVRVLEGIKNAGGDAQVQSAVDRIKQLAADGIQGGEQNETVALFQQLLSKSEASRAENSKLLQQVIGVIDLSVSAMQGIPGRLDEQARQIKAIQAQLGSRNP